MKTLKIPSHFFMALACMQVFSGSPEVNTYVDPYAHLRARFQRTAPDALDMPVNLERALAPLVRQGFYIMAWEPSQAGTGYMVDLYHSAPARLDQRREEIHQATKSGRGLAIRRFIRTE